WSICRWAWSRPSADRPDPASRHRPLDLVYLPMGVTTPDIWGGNRTPEQERYASSTLADITVNGQKVPGIYAPAETGNN
ncbi:hypothetical protein PS014_24810, partial [Shigella sonnei]|nr:hypothetical protein [Shigella sonnei]